MNKYLLLFFYFLAVAILFYPVIFQNNTFGSGDTLNPYAINHILDIYKDKIGQWPLWQPWIFSGMPTVEAFTYINQLYIPTTILTWLGFSDNGIQFIHLIFSAMGMYLLMKQFKMNSLISFSISLLWMLNPFLITMIVFGHGSQMMTAAYIPWIIYAINNLYRNTSLRNALILALLIGLQLQRGHIQIAYYSWMLFGAYFLYHDCYYIKNKVINYKYENITCTKPELSTIFPKFCPFSITFVLLQIKQENQKQIGIVAFLRCLVVLAVKPWE